MMCSTIHLSFSTLTLASSRSWSLFLDMGVRYSANSTLSCCTASSLEPCTLYTHMKGSFFCSPWQVCISQSYIFSLLATTSLSFLLLCFLSFSVALFNHKMLAILPHKITASWEKFFFPWNAKKIIMSDALLQISSHAHCSRARWILWVILQAYF